jgi:ankyrin repeat protein
LRQAGALLEAGADPFITMQHTVSALALAARSGNVDIVKLLIDTGVQDNVSGGSTSLHYAAQAGKYAVAELLLTTGGSNVHAVTKVQKTALHCAAHEGHVAVVKLLLERGASIDSVSEKV